MNHLLIIGATSTIAQEVARAACDREGGVHLTLVARNASHLEQCAADLQTRGAKVTTHATDFAAADWAAICASPGSDAPRIDACLVAHGVLPDESSFPPDAEVVRRTIDSNLTTALEAINAVTAAFMRDGGGHLTVITSVAGDRGRQSNVLYGCTKGAKSTYLEGLQHRLVVTNHTEVTVTDLKLGMVATRMTEHLPPSGLMADPAELAPKILHTFDSRPPKKYLPWIWGPVMFGIRHLPRFLFEKTEL